MAEGCRLLVDTCVALLPKDLSGGNRQIDGQMDETVQNVGG
jgi:hypothetical protein